MTSGGSKKSGQSVPGEDSGSQAKTHDQCCGTSADVLETDHLILNICLSIDPQSPPKLKRVAAETNLAALGASLGYEAPKAGKL